MDETFQTVDVVLYQVEEDPVGFAEDSDESLTDIFEQAGNAVGSACGPEGAPQAYSDLVVYLSDQKSERGSFAGTYIDGMLEALCVDAVFELTLPAQAVCRPFS